MCTPDVGLKICTLHTYIPESMPKQACKLNHKFSHAHVLQTHERGRDQEGEMNTETDPDTHRHRDTDQNTNTPAPRTHTDTRTHRHANIHTHTDTQTHGHTHTHRQRQPSVTRGCALALAYVSASIPEPQSEIKARRGMTWPVQVNHGPKGQVRRNKAKTNKGSRAVISQASHCNMSFSPARP